MIGLQSFLLNLDQSIAQALKSIFKGHLSFHKNSSLLSKLGNCLQALEKLECEGARSISKDLFVGIPF